MLESLREETEGKLQMPLSLRRNGLTSLFKEVGVFKVFGGDFLGQILAADSLPGAFVHSRSWRASLSEDLYIVLCFCPLPLTEAPTLIRARQNRRVPPCAVKTCAVRPVFVRVVGSRGQQSQANVQGPMKQNASPEQQSEAPRRRWKPGQEQHPGPPKPGQSAHAESTQGSFPDKRSREGVVRGNGCPKGRFWKDRFLLCPLKVCS